MKFEYNDKVRIKGEGGYKYFNKYLIHRCKLTPNGLVAAVELAYFDKNFLICFFYILDKKL